MESFPISLPGPRSAAWMQLLEPQDRILLEKRTCPQRPMKAKGCSLTLPGALRPAALGGGIVPFYR